MRGFPTRITLPLHPGYNYSPFAHSSFAPEAFTIAVHFGISAVI